MPHDKDGRPLNVGDPVHVPCRITAISPGTDYCNVQLETEELMHPGPNKSTISLNARQVLKAVMPPVAALLAALTIGLACAVSFAQEQGVAPSIGPLTTIEAGAGGQAPAASVQHARRVAVTQVADCPTCVRVERPTRHPYPAASGRGRVKRRGPGLGIGQAVRRWFSRRW